MDGIDLVNIERIKAMLKDDPSIKERIFTSSEIEYCERFENPRETKYEKYAARFGLKESVAKLIKSGPADYHLHIEILHKEDGSPYVQLSDELQKIYPHDIHVAITHEPPFAMIAVRSGCKKCQEKLDDEMKHVKEKVRLELATLTPTHDF